MFKFLKKIFASGVTSPRAHTAIHPGAQPLIGDKVDDSRDYKARGNALLSEGKLEEAAQCYLHAVSINPCYVESHINLGYVFGKQKRYREAELHLKRAIQIDPANVDGLFMLGNLFQEQGHWSEATVQLDSVLALKPDFEITFRILLSLNRYDDAVECCNEALRVNPDYANVYLNRGIALMGLNQCDDAIQSFTQALSIDPSHGDAHFNEGLARLMTGDFERGWKLYEWRWKNYQLNTFQRNFSQPLWLGKESLNGKTILIHCEQGYGDTMQFCRYVSILAALGAHVLLEVQGGLKSLLGNLAGANQILEHGESLPDFDYHCPLMSLPLACSTTLATIPTAIRYIDHDEHRFKAWQARLGEKGKPRVGIAWSGSLGHKNDRNRSIPLSDLCKLMCDEVQFISLQKEVRSSDYRTLKHQDNVAHYGTDLNDFTDTAALIDSVDLVISVDTSVAHLAGAMGKPVWILLPFNPDWRWLLGRNDTPWYPSARLFRQPKIDDWESVITRLREEVQNWQRGQCRPSAHKSDT